MKPDMTKATYYLKSSGHVKSAFYLKVDQKLRRSKDSILKTILLAIIIHHNIAHIQLLKQAN